MKILYLTGREASYARNDVLLRALLRLGSVNVAKTPTSGPLLWKNAVALVRALQLLFHGPYDLVFVGFYGHLLVLPLAWLTRAPILFDAFVSTYDTLCFDRQIFSPQSPAGRLSLWLDKTACRLASRVLVDTPLQAEYFSASLGVAPDRVSALPVGCNEDLFSPRCRPARQTSEVLYYCTYQPLHGADLVVRAASLLAGHGDLRFRLVGKGPTYRDVRLLADQLRLENVIFEESVPLASLPDQIAASDICLGGPFGTTAKASRVIPGKIYQILAVGCPLVAADTPANRGLLKHGQTALLCAPGSPEELARAILSLHLDAGLAMRLSAAGRTLYMDQCSESVITERLEGVIREMVP